jgi:hypothetical protein
MLVNEFLKYIIQNNYTMDNRGKRRLMDDLFVLFRLACACGTTLEVHGQYIIGGWQGRHAVTCPKCKNENELPTRPLRFFYEDGDHLVAAAL